MQTINIHKAKNQLSRLIDQAAAGEDIIIARAGKPIARLTSLQSQPLQPRKLGLGKDRFTMPQDFDHLYAQIPAYFLTTDHVLSQYSDLVIHLTLKKR
jgi:prevent-host-death family protein